MPPLLDRKLRFSDAAYAIDAPPKTLRNWLQRNQVAFGFGGEGAKTSGWREFSLSDIAVLALVRKLVEFGVTVEEASDIANSTLLRFAALSLAYRNTPPQALVAVFAHRRLYLWREAGEWKHEPRTDPLDADEPSHAYAVLSLGPILDRAFSRALAGRGDSGADSMEDVAAAIEKLTLTIQDATPSGDGE